MSRLQPLSDGQIIPQYSRAKPYLPIPDDQFSTERQLVRQFALSFLLLRLIANFAGVRVSR